MIFSPDTSDFWFFPPCRQNLPRLSFSTFFRTSSPPFAKTLLLKGLPRWELRPAAESHSGELQGRYPSPSFSTTDDSRPGAKHPPLVQPIVLQHSRVVQLEVQPCVHVRVENTTAERGKSCRKVASSCLNRASRSLRSTFFGCSFAMMLPS